MAFGQVFPTPPTSCQHPEWGTLSFPPALPLYWLLTGKQLDALHHQLVSWIKSLSHVHFIHIRESCDLLKVVSDPFWRSSSELAERINPMETIYLWAHVFLAFEVNPGWQHNSLVIFFFFYWYYVLGLCLACTPSVSQFEQRAAMMGVCYYGLTTWWSLMKTCSLLGERWQRIQLVVFFLVFAFKQICLSICNLKSIKNYVLNVRKVTLSFCVSDSLLICS